MEISSQIAILIVLYFTSRFILNIYSDNKTKKYIEHRPFIVLAELVVFAWGLYDIYYNIVSFVV